MYVYIKFLVIVSFLALFVVSGKVAGQETEALQVTGRISDASTGLPLAAISVSVPNFSATTTNDSGLFVLKVPNYEVTLELSAKDYQLKEVSLKGRKNVSAKLYEDAFNSVFDVVNLPYSQKAKSQTVNSVITVNATWANPSESPESMVQGKIVGLNTNFKSGALAVGANMFLRGYSSLYATNKPLIIVDGMIYDDECYSASQIKGFEANPLADIDVKDIESITVLKDAVSLYGSKAANGVILINTVHAHEAATKVEFYAHSGLNMTPKNLPVMNAADFKEYLTEQFQNNGLTSAWILAQPYMSTNTSSANYRKYNNNTNWQDEVFDRTRNQDYYLRVTGGDEIAKYGLSVGYLNNKGIIRNTDYSRYTTRFNADVSASTDLTINANLGFTYGEHNIMEDGLARKTNPLYLALTKSPFFTPSIIDSLGQTTQKLEDVDSLGVGNPQSVLNSLEAKNKAYRFVGSVKLNYRLGTNWNFSSMVGFTFDKNEQNVFIPDYGLVADTLTSAVAYSTVRSDIKRFTSIYNDNRIQFNKVYENKHSLTVNVGMRYNTNATRDDVGTSYNTPTDALKYLDSGTSILDRSDGSTGSWNWLSYYSGVDYSLFRKYFVSFNMSVDGSSRYGVDANGISLFSHKFGVFPSLGAAWLVSSENIMASITSIDLLKLRGSYGLTGNDDVGNFQNSKYYSSQRFIGYVGLVQGNIPNTKIQWETNKKLNLGLDMALLNERLQLAFDYYHNITDNMLTNTPTDLVSGYSSALINNGSLVNNGVELTIDGRIINGLVKWDLGAGIAHYINKLKKMPGGNYSTQISGATLLSAVGNPLGVFYGYKSNGVFASDAEAVASGQTNKLANGQTLAAKGGDIRFADLDNNGVIDANDREVIGDPNPDFTGMITSKLAWKGFTLDMLFTFSKGNDVFNALRLDLEAMSGYANQSNAVINRWRTDGQVTDIPKATPGDPMGNSRFSSRWIEDGSYLKLKTLSLSYDFKVKPRFFQNLLVYVAVNNVFTITNYLGYDPEFSMSSSALAQGIDAGLTPQFRSVYMGVKIGL
jgi:TonB-linked SusC/RagA family outer membrane protein